MTNPNKNYFGILADENWNKEPVSRSDSIRSFHKRSILPFRFKVLQVALEPSCHPFDRTHPNRPQPFPRVSFTYPWRYFIKHGPDELVPFV